MNTTIGAGVTYNIGCDGYPLTIRKVSSGTQKDPSAPRMIWCSRDEFRAGPGNRFEEFDKHGVFIPRDEDNPEAWECYTLRKDGRYRPCGSKCGYLSEGRAYRRDPHF